MFLPDKTLGEIEMKYGKNFFVVLSAIVLIGVIYFSTMRSCSAITFYQLVKIGDVGQNDSYGISIEGASEIKAVQGKSLGKYESYSKGKARFGQSLYFYFDHDKLREIGRYDSEITDEISRFGSSNPANSVPIFVLEGGTQIYQIKNDQGRELYLFITETARMDEVVAGTTKDGKWVKFIDSNDFRIKYPSDMGRWGHFICKLRNDTLILECQGWSDRSKIREFRFKWNDSTQWFDVEKIFY